MKTLLKKRRSLSSQIKVLEQSISEPAELTQEHLLEYHGQAVALRKENVDLHDLISIKSSDETYDQHEQQFCELAERINKLKVALDGFFTRGADGSLMNMSMSVLYPGGPMARMPTEVRLPQLDLPVFDGDLYKWLSYHDLFKAVFHDNAGLSGAQKLQYLKASLKGEPALLIQSIPISNVNYSEAWGLLVARYECKRELIRAQFERLIIQPNLTCESPMALRKLVDTTTECVRSLEVMKLSKEELFDLMVIHLISKKLDADSRRQWERCLVDTSLPSFDSFVKFLDTHARIMAATLATPGKVVAKVPVTKNYAVMQDGVLKVKCEVCKGDHLVFKCEEFLKLSIPQRIETVKRLRLCFNCLRRGHNSQQCSSGQCKKCQRCHHTLIHLDRTVQRPAEFIPVVESAEIVSASPVVSEVGAMPQVLLATALIRVQDGKGRRVVCRAFLDNGSQGSFVTEQCVQKL